jgi:hypothetical protein
MAQQLQLMGYTPFVDFMDYELAAALLAGKEIALFYGYCHLRGVRDYLSHGAAYSDRYTGFYFPNYLVLSAYKQQRLEYLIHFCSLFFYGMAVTPENHRKNEAILSRLGKQVQTVCLSPLYFGGYFPQEERAFNHMNAYAVKAEGYDYTPFSYGDSWLNRCIAQGWSTQRILEEYRGSSVYEESFLQTYLKQEWKRIRFQESQCGVRILDYIQDNYRKKRLFRNEAHMENSVLKEYARQILQQLGLAEALPDLEEPLLLCSQHLIYPCVGRSLGLMWEVESEELELYTYTGWRKVTPSEYVELYVTYCREVHRLKDMALLP